MAEEDRKKQKQLRALYKQLDSYIEEQIIFPTKYPKKTSFVRKLLKRAPKRPKEDMIKDVETSLASSKAALLSMARRHGTGLDMSDAELGMEIYDRISNKISSHLKIGKSDRDEIFTKANNNLLKESNDPSKINSLIGPHLVNWDKQDPSLKNTKQFAEYRKDLSQIAASYNNKPYKQDVRIQVQNILTKTAPENEKEKEAAKLEEYRKEYYTSLIEENKKRKKYPKKSLTAFEEEGVKVMEKLDNNPDRDGLFSELDTEQELMQESKDELLKKEEDLRYIQESSATDHILINIPSFIWSQEIQTFSR